MPWLPTRFDRFEAALNTSTQVCQIVTDAGKAYLKALGNRQGPHVLAADWLGTRLAGWLGLPTLDCAIISLGPEDEVPIAPGVLAQSGPSFATRAEKGNAWGGDAAALLKIVNRPDIAGMVVLDTWTRNCDRYAPAGYTRRPNPDNVYISRDREQSPLLVPIDHGCCFTCGGDLTPALAHIDRIQETQVYGLFPEFRAHVTAERLAPFTARLATCTSATVREFVDEIPAEWDVNAAARTALVDFSVERAAYVAANIGNWLHVRH